MVALNKTRLFAQASPRTTNFQRSGSNTTAATGASTSLPTPANDSTINVTDGSGVTSLTALVQATQDNSNWTTIGTINLTALGTASLVVGIPYLGLRVNVTSLAGGNASATLVEGQTPLGRERRNGSYEPAAYRHPAGEPQHHRDVRAPGNSSFVRLDREQWCVGANNRAQLHLL